MQMARAKLLLAVDASQVPFITGIQDPRLIWKALHDVHRAMSVNSILSLRRRFFHMAKAEDETTLFFISRVRRAALELANTPAPVTELDQILVITDGLPPQYAPVATALDNLSFDQLNMQNLISRVTGLEAQFSRTQEGTEELQALIARRRWPKNTAEDASGLTCYCCGGRGHVAAVCPSSGPHAAKVAIAEEALDAEEIPISLSANTAIIRTGDEESHILNLI